ncbi:MAG: AmmeMemoRadiSam system protein A [Acidimicrobiales bacterium]|nr:AmmeMemoRadiSam system protein A [Acidimicrobiales bacterium]
MTSHAAAADVLSTEHLESLLGVAETALRRAVAGVAGWAPDPASHAAPLAAPGASFVTLERDERLIGCMGTLTPRRPLVVDVADHALAAAFRDPRSPGLAAHHVDELTITVSVLSALEPVPASDPAELAAALRPGIDGVLVEAGNRRGTLLPAVWHHVPAAAAFVEALQLKAGFGRRWPGGVRAHRYTTQIAVRRPGDGR